MQSLYTDKARAAPALSGEKAASEVKAEYVGES